MVPVGDRVSETRRRTPWKEGRTKAEVGLLYLMSYLDSDGILVTLAKFSQKGSKEMKTEGRRTHT